MQEQLNDLKRFQEAFKLKISDHPTLITQREYILRYELSKEELEEYYEECEKGNIVGIFDAIVDRLFLVLGDAVTHGFADVLVEGFNEVMRSNMSKLDDNGQPLINGVNGEFDPTRPIGKVLKSKNYSEPDLESILDRKYSIKKEQ